VMIMNQGTIVADGPMERVLADEELLATNRL
jgi:hypothetical protein